MAQAVLLEGESLFILIAFHREEVRIDGVILFLQKWKQLSRLQRSLILFTLMLLLVCGIVTSPTLIEHWRGEPQ